MKTEEWRDLIYNYKLTLWLWLEDKVQKWNPEGKLE